LSPKKKLLTGGEEKNQKTEEFHGADKGGTLKRWNKIWSKIAKVRDWEMRSMKPEVSP